MPSVNQGLGEEVIDSHRGSPSLPEPAWIPPDSASGSGSLSSPGAGTGMCWKGQVPEARQGPVGERKRQLTELLTEAKFNGKSSSLLYYTLVSQTKKNLQVKKVLMVTQHFIHIS